MVAVAWFLLGAAALSAQSGHLELFSGIYQSHSDTVGEEEIYGVRGGYDFAPTWGAEVSAGQFEKGAERIIEGFVAPRKIRLQVFSFDLSFVWRPVGDGLMLFAGPGLVDVDLEEFIETTEGEEVRLQSAQDLSWHAGAAYRWSLSPGFYLRADVRGRYSKTDLYEQQDYEATVAAGWRF